MKKIILLLSIVCVGLISCTKDKENLSDPGISGSIEYKVNGEQVTFSSGDALNGEGVIFAKQLKGTAIPYTRYLLNAQKGINNALAMTIITDSLKVETYSYDSTYSSKKLGLFVFTFLEKGQQSMLYFNSDYLKVNITSYKGGKVSGTFEAKATPITGGLNYSNKGAVTITDGKFTDIQMTY